jgi:hypothetical protein
MLGQDLLTLLRRDGEEGAGYSRGDLAADRQATGKLPLEQHPQPPPRQRMKRVRHRDE